MTEKDCEWLKGSENDSKRLAKDLKRLEKTFVKQGKKTKKDPKSRQQDQKWLKNMPIQMHMYVYCTLTNV
jgi:hypothetical protein